MDVIAYPCPNLNAQLISGSTRGSWGHYNMNTIFLDVGIPTTMEIPIDWYIVVPL